MSQAVRSAICWSVRPKELMGGSCTLDLSWMKSSAGRLLWQVEQLLEKSCAPASIEPVMPAGMLKALVWPLPSK